VNEKGITFTKIPTMLWLEGD